MADDMVEVRFTFVETEAGIRLQSPDLPWDDEVVAIAAALEIGRVFGANGFVPLQAASPRSGTSLRS